MKVGLRTLARRASIRSLGQAWQSQRTEPSTLGLANSRQYLRDFCHLLFQKELPVYLFCLFCLWAHLFGFWLCCLECLPPDMSYRRTWGKRLLFVKRPQSHRVSTPSLREVTLATTGSERERWRVGMIMTWVFQLIKLLDVCQFRVMVLSIFYWICFTRLEVYIMPSSYSSPK